MRNYNKNNEISMILAVISGSLAIGLLTSSFSTATTAKKEESSDTNEKKVQIGECKSPLKQKYKSKL